MLIKVHTNETKELEIKLPFYCKSKSGQFIYNIISENRAIQVVNFDGDWGIKTVSAELALHGGYVEIDEREFDTAFEEVLGILKGMNL